MMRVPYPMGFYAKGMDGRIDDPNAGWKGSGLWTTYATRAVAHIEGGKGTTSKVVHIPAQARPAGALTRRRIEVTRSYLEVMRHTPSQSAGGVVFISSQRPI